MPIATCGRTPRCAGKRKESHTERSGTSPATSFARWHGTVARPLVAATPMYGFVDVDERTVRARSTTRPSTTLSVPSRGRHERQRAARTRLAGELLRVTERGDVASRRNRLWPDGMITRFSPSGHFIRPRGLGAEVSRRFAPRRPQRATGYAAQVHARIAPSHPDLYIGWGDQRNNSGIILYPRVG